MTDKVYTYVFNLLNQQTALLITKYSEDEKLINDLYSDMLLGLTKMIKKGSLII